MNDTLRIGLLHLDVKHGCVEENREALVAHALEAARSGANIIVSPELCVSGYSFESRADISGCVEKLAGATLDRISPIAKRYGIYICAGIAEVDPATDIYYNTAIVAGPHGDLAAHHRKAVPAERRWACPGEVSRSSVFETPWGRIGLLICADSYFGLLPRSLALHGADLVFVLANWPPLGVDPRLIWRARALENGFGVIGCNRTGVDRTMDCRSSRSYAVLPTGETLLDEARDGSHIFLVDYPTTGGRLSRELRENIMARRHPGDFAELYLDVNGLEDLSGMWGLPPGGPLEIRCLVPKSRREALPALEACAAECNRDPVLLIIPRGMGAFLPDQISRLVEGRPLGIVSELAGQNGDPSAYGLISSTRRVGLPPGGSHAVADFGPARIALVRPGALAHPEVAVSLSKKGCDLLITSPSGFGPDERLLFSIKCLERAAVAVAAPGGATVCEPPVGHLQWKEELVNGPGVCSARIDTAALRTKRFHDRVDMEILLRR